MRDFGGEALSGHTVLHSRLLVNFASWTLNGRTLVALDFLEGPAQHGSFRAAHAAQGVSHRRPTRKAAMAKYINVQTRFSRPWLR